MWCIYSVAGSNSWKQRTGLFFPFLIKTCWKRLYVMVIFVIDYKSIKYTKSQLGKINSVILTFFFSLSLAVKKTHTHLMSRSWSHISSWFWSIILSCGFSVNEQSPTRRDCFSLCREYGGRQCHHSMSEVTFCLYLPPLGHHWSAGKDAVSSSESSRVIQWGGS